MASLKSSAGVVGEAQMREGSIIKYSMLLQDSSSDSDTNATARRPIIADKGPLDANKGDATVNEFFTAFQNKYNNKDIDFRMARLKAYREDSTMQSLARAVFDFSLDDKKHFEFLFETEGNLKLMWQFVFLSFMDQELLMLELRYKQQAEDFNRINTHQFETGLIAKKDGPKVYRLFKLFCLNDKVFNAFISRPKNFTTKPEEKAETRAEAGAMDIESGLKLPAYTDTDIIMDDEVRQRIASH